MSAFADFFKAKRVSMGKTLRQFCHENNLDPGNMSRMERGLYPPPQDRNKLEEYASFLGIKEGSDDWYQFFDLAAAESGRIPSELMAEREVVERLPILFRTLRGQKISDEQMDKLAELLKKA